LSRLTARGTSGETEIAFPGFPVLSRGIVLPNHRVFTVKFVLARGSERVYPLVDWFPDAAPACADLLRPAPPY